MNTILTLATGAALGALATLVTVGAKQLDLTLIDVETGETVEFCGGTHFQIKVGGSSLKPMGVIACPKDPCGGMVIRDKDGKFVHAIVPGVPVDFDCKAARTAAASQ